MKKGFFAGVVLLALAGYALAQSNTVCAVVKLQILQTATFEREAFDASLEVSNNLTETPLTNLKVQITIRDPEGNPADGLFFVKVTTLTGTNAVDGTGVVQSSSTAQINWLIIPSSGTGGVNPAGRRYAVKAAITGMSGTDPQGVTTFDEFITVHPQPVLRLEYVLPFETFGDEPLTEDLEGIEPFPLGVRVTNIGYGTATDFKIDSAQPKILDNKQSLPIDFKLLGSVVSGKEVPNSLLIPFGDIGPGGVGQAYWQMSTSLSGRFIEFRSSFTHAASLGGNLTSLLQDIRTYTLLHDVQVDLPGRDRVPDFLVNASVDRNAMQSLLDTGEQPAAELLLESDQQTALEVTEVPAELTGTLGGTDASLSLVFTSPVSTNVWAHTSVPFPYGRGANVNSARRGDGKVLNLKNVWISKHFRKGDLTTLYRLNVLDLTGASTSYIVQFSPLGLDLPPGRVTTLAAVTAPESGALDLSWAAPGEDGAFGRIVGGRYLVQADFSTSTVFASGSTQVRVTTSTTPGSLESLRARGLVGNATNYVRLWTQDTGGNISEVSNGATAYTLPYPPKDLLFSAITSTSILGTWTIGNNRLPMGYQVSASSAPGGVALSASPVQDSFTSDFVFGGLSPNTTIYFTGIGLNTDTGVASAASSLGSTVTYAEAPSVGSLVAVPPSSAAAVWGLAGNPADTEFYAELSTSADHAPVAQASGWIRATTAVFGDLAQQTPYYGRVKARNRTGIETAYVDLGALTTPSDVYVAASADGFGSLSSNRPDETITAVSTDSRALAMGAAAAQNLALVGSLYELEPSPVLFDPPATLSLTVDPDGRAPATISLYRFNGVAWDSAPVTSQQYAVDAATAVRFSGRLSGASLYGAFAGATPTGADITSVDFVRGVSVAASVETVAVDAATGEFFVNVNTAVKKYDAAGNLLTTFGTAGAGAGQFGSIRGMRLGPDGQLYIADSSNHVIHVYTTAGAFVSDLTGQFTAPQDLFFDTGDKLNVLDMSLNGVYRLELGGAFISSITVTGTSPFGGLAMSPQDDYYVSNYTQRRVYKYSQAGALLATLGDGPGAAAFNRPRYLDVDADGRAHVADWFGNRIAVFSGAGVYIGEYGTAQTTPQGVLASPLGVAVVKTTGRVYVGVQTTQAAFEYALNTAPLPAPLVLSPAQGKTVHATAPVVVGRSRSGLAVELLDGGVLIASATVSDPRGFFLLSPPLAAGPHSLSARASSAFGAVSPVGPAIAFTAAAAPAPFQFGAPIYKPAPIPPYADMSARASATGDFNGDGHADLLLLGEIGYAAFAGDGQGGFTALPPVAAPTPGGFGHFARALAADLNQDGKLDAVAAVNEGDVRVLPGNGDGTFGTMIVLAPDYTRFYIPDLAVTDATGDGRPDIVAATCDSLQVLAGQGGFSFANGPVIPVSTGPFVSDCRLRLEDFNRDARPDAVVGGSVLLGAAGGGFGPAATVCANCNLAAAGDFNGDGNPDLAVALFAVGLRTYLGLGQGEFVALSTQAAIPMGRGYEGTGPTPDLNLDGLADLAVGRDGAVDLLASRGDGTFGPAYAVGLGSACVSVQTLSYGDLREDAAPDLATAMNYSACSVDEAAILLNEARSPAPVVDLAAAPGAVDGEVVLSWTNTGDDAQSGDLLGAQFVVRYSTGQIADSAFVAPSSGTVTVSTNAPAGSAQTLTIGGLYPGTTWYFAVAIVDAAGHAGLWSRAGGANALNSAPARDLPPGAPSSARVTATSSATVALAWDAPPAPAYDDLSSYKVYRATYVFTSAGEPNVTLAASVAAPQTSVEIGGLYPDTTSFWAVAAADLGDLGGGLFSVPLEGALSNAVSTVTAPAFIPSTPPNPADTRDVRFAFTIGGNGSAPGLFDNVMDVAVDPDGFVYASDQLNSRVQKLTPEGQFLLAWGEPGSGPGQFGAGRAPAGLSACPAPFSGILVAADELNARVQIFTSTGGFLGQIGPVIGSTTLLRPRGAACDASGNVYVADHDLDRIFKTDMAGNQLASWPLPPFSNPAVDEPVWHLAVDAGGFIYASGGPQVLKFTPDGTLVRSFGAGYGTNPGQFTGTKGIAFDAFGNLYATDSCRTTRCVQIFEPTGDFAVNFSSPGSGPGQLTQNYPFGVAVHRPTGRIYVADTFNDRIEVFAVEPSTAVSPAPACGAHVFGLVTLDQDLVCAGDGLTAVASGTTIDCAGRSITFATGTAGVGVRVAGLSGVTVRDCVLVAGSTTALASPSAYLSVPAVAGADALENTSFASSSSTVKILGPAAIISTFAVTAENFELAFNAVRLSTALADLDGTAEVSLHRLTFSTPVARWDPDGDGVQTDCPETACAPLSYAGGTFTFRAPGLGAFFSREGGTFTATSGEGTIVSNRADETIAAVSAPSQTAAFAAAAEQGLTLMTLSYYELQPSPVVFDPPALLSFTFDPAAVDTNTIAIYRYNGPEWSSAPVAGQTLELLGPSSARISGYLSSASLYAVFRTSAAPAAGLAWTQLSPAPDPVHGAPSPRVFNSTVYNPASKRLIVFAGAGAGGYGVLDDVWVLSGADGAGGAPAWTKLAPDAPSGAPGARDAHVAVYDQANNRMIIHGGYNSPGSCGGVVSDAWVLTNADGTGGTPAWIPLSPAGTAPARRYHRAAYDAANNRLIVNGGAPSGCGAGGNDTWVLTNANGLGGTPAWTQLAPAAPANFPADSSGGSAGYDPASNRFLRLHHIDGSITAWALSNGNGLGGVPAWSEVDGGTRPAVLDWVGPGGTYDPGTNTFVFFGAGAAASSETWTLSGANGVGASQWTRLEPAGQPDARVWASLVYAPGSDRATMFGGSKNGWDGTGEVWTLANALGAPAAPAVLTAISVAPSSGTLDAGSTLQLAAAGTFSSGLTRSLIASDGVAWSVDAGTVASVDASGLVTGASAGAARVTASSGAVSGFADLIVNATYFVAVSGDGAATLASSRGDETITAVSTGSVAAAYAAAVSSQGLVLMTPSLYELSPSPVVFDPPAILTLRFDPVGVDTATVSIYRFNGVAWDSAPVAGQQIVAIGGGLFEISGILQSASLYAAFSLPVPAPTLASITVTPSTASVLAGTTAQFEAAGTFTDGSTRTVTGEVAWTTDVSSVATVTASGLASGAAAGTARVIASSGAVSGYATLTVTVPPPPALTVASIAPSSAATGSSVAAALTGAGFDASAALSLERTSVAQGTWTAAGAFTQDRMMGTMTKLRDGRALLAGGTNDGSTAFADVDLYDPATGSWTAAPPLNQGRNQHAAVLLADGRVLVAGGYAGGFINSTEIYDPALNAWATAAPMASGRVGHQLALLADGRVLAAGGWNGASELSSAEIYDPAADSWSPAAPMSEGRVYPSMTLMNNGKALVAGGSSSATAEVYDPAANAWTAAGTLSAARQNLRSVVLPDGKVLATGGTGPAGTSNAADVYDPATNGWTATAPMGVARLGHAMVSASGTPLVIGGENPPTNLASTEIYDAATNAWLPGPSLSGSRTWLHALALDDGRVLAAGGRRDGTTLNTAEALGAAAVSIAATGVTVTDAQHLTGTLELIGAATGYWDVVVRESGGRVGRLDGGFRVLAGAPVLASIAVTPSMASIPVGATAQFEAAGTFTDGSTRTLTGEVVWSTDVSSVATVNAGGLAAGAAAGRARIVASSGPITSYATLTVTFPALTVVSIAPSSATTGTSVAAVLVGTGFDASAVLTLERSDVLRGTWTATGSFAQGRYYSTLTKLSDGRALLAGGLLEGTAAGVAAVDLYDPATGAWTSGPALNMGRRQHEAVKLADGRVLVAGGNGPTGAIVNTAEIYDPALSAWTAAAPMGSVRTGHRLALLSDGRVLAAGGWNGASELSSAEIYDPAADSWSPAAPMSEGRVYPSMTLMNNGKALVAGGSSSATAEVYDPAANTWTAAGTLSAARQNLRSVVLPGGKVLATGGTGPAGTSNAADVYDPATNGWTATGPMGVPRYAHAMVLVDGTPLIIGGENSSANLATTESYDAAANAWLPGPSLLATRSWLQAVVLDDGRVLAAGGRRILGGATHLNTAEVLGGEGGQIVATGVTAADAEHLSGALDLTGAATGYWDVVVRESGGRVGRLNGGFRVLPGAPVLASIAVTPSTASVLAGTTAQFAAAGTFTDGSTRTLTGEVAWTTDVSSVATVGASGLATGVAAGTARVIASSGAVSGHATLTVTPAPVTLASITVTPAAASVPAGGTVQFAAVGVLTDGSTVAFASSDGTWQSQAAMNAARLGAPGEFAGGKFFVFGGFNGTGLTSTEAYDPLTDVWTFRAAQPVNRSYSQAAEAGGKIYVVGGCINADCGAVTNALWMYDPAADTWTQKASIPTARFHFSFENIGGKLYAAGGYLPGFSLSTALEVYDPATNAWTARAPLPQARAMSAAGEIGGKLYMSGGTTGATTADLRIYDPAVNSWTAGAPQPLARLAQSGAVLNGKLYAFGDGGGSEATARKVFVYDAAANAWSEGAGLSVGRYNAAAASDGTRLCVAGSGLGNTATASLEVLRPASELVWSTDVSSVATVSASGLATAVAAGTARVIASSGAISGYATLTVPAPTLASIAVTPVSASLQAGATAQFTAAGTFTDGSTRTLTGEVAWTTDVSSVAAVDAGGLATAVAAGTARVIASAGAVSGYATLAVTPPPVTLASIAVTPAAATLLAGATAQFAAVGTFSDGSTRAFASGTGAWLSRTPMNTARTGAAGAFAGGKFFVFGGVALTSTEAYDPLTGAWTARAAQPVNRSYAQAAELDGKIYVVGGAVNADGNAATSALWMYDPAADAWTQKASMPTARFHLSFEAIDGKLYAAGGLVPGYSATSALAVYDPATNAWQTKASMPLARGHVAGGVIGGKLYVAGGSPTAAELQIYDPASDAWTLGASQPLARYAQMGAVLDGRLHVMGGQSAAGTEADGKRTFVYDAAAGAWSEGAPLNAARYAPAAAAGGGKIFVAGSLFGNLNTTALEELTPTGEAAWSVDASSVATVTATGLATALSEGAARVTASAGAVTGYATLTVTPPPVTLASIAVTPAASSILTGGTAQFAAAGTFSDGSTRTLTGEVAWSTDVSSVATVTASGLATGVGGGTARVIASSGTVTGYANLTVTVPAPTVTSIAPSSAAAGASVTAALTGTGFDASAALSLERSDALRGTWSATGSFTQGRYAGTLTKLRDGRVLLAGGIIGAATVGSADVDLYDPATGSWTAGPPLNQGRNQYAAVRLADGRVLVAGGYGPGTALASVEIYDPALSTWTAAASMASARVWTHLAVLGDGRVLAAGGHDGTSYLSSAEIYDPAADSWSPAAPLGEGTAGAAIATLSSGKVLIAGGFGAKATAEVYDPAANAWTSAGSMSVAHYLPEAVMLPGGKVLVTAGSSAGGAEPASVYDPATNAWTATGLMGVQRYVHAMVLVNGTALVVGGENSSTNLASTEIYDAATNAWRPGPGLTAARTWARAVALDDGRVLVAGGQQGGANSNTAELLGAPAAVIAAAGVTVTDAQHLSGNVDLTGAATGYWDVVVRESGGRIGRLDAGFRITEPPVPAAPTLTSLAVTPSTASIPAGATAQFAAAGTFTDGSTRTLTGEVVWSTDVSSVATVDANGLATGVGGGTAHVIASSGAITGQAALGVAYVATSTGTVGGSPELTLVSTAPFSVVLVSSQAVEGTIALGSAAAQGITLVSALYDVTRQDPGATATLTWFFDPALVDAAALAIWRYDGISWSSVTVLNQTVSVTDGVGTVTGEVVLTSLFGLFARDVLPPVTALLVDGLPSGATSQAIASTSSIGFAAADAGVGVRETLYALDGGAEAVFVSSFSLAAGPHALTYRSVDRAGNQEAARTVAIAVTDPSSDAAPPLVRLDFPDAAALGVERAVGGVVTVRGSAADGSALTWTLSAGLTVLASGTGNVSGALAAWDTAALTGPQTLTLSATDAYGNAASTSAQVFVGAPAMTFAVGRKDSDAIVSTLKGPTGIAVRSDGAVWVASTENDKILLISSAGVLLGAAGHAPGHSGEDREHGKKEKEDEDHEDEEHGRGNSALSFKSPQGLALDAADHLYVADRDLNRVLKLSSDGQVLLLELGKPGSGPGKLKRPFDAAVDVNGDIYVADSGHRRIAVFDASGVFLRQFGQDALPAESEVRGIALTSEGLWVSDKESERIYLFSRAGGLIKSIGGADSVVGEISRTRGLAADRLGALYVVEPNRDRAQKFDPQGKGLLAFGSKAGLSRADKLAKRYLTQPFDAALAPDGSIWLTDAGRDRIVRYALPVSGGYGVAAYSAGGGAASSASLEPARRVVDHADGATVSRDDGAGVSVPKGALTADLEITVDAGDENLDKEQKTVKRREMKIKAASGEVQYGPEGTIFNAPVTLILPYDAELIASQGIREDDLKVYYWNPTLKDWQAMPSTVDKQNKTVSAQTIHFSVYQAGGPSGGVGVAAVIDEFGLRDQYAFPNPSRNGASVTFRIQPGLADSIEVRVYDVSGRKVHSSSDFRFSVLDDGNGKGAQNTYDHGWNVSGVGSGIYTYVIKASRAGQTPIVKTGKAGVIK